MNGPALRAAALRGAALGFVLLDAALVQARAAPLDGVRALSSATPDTSGDAQALGRTRLAADDLPGALGAFRQALAQNPQSADALNGIAVCYDRLGQFPLSRTYYELALASAPGSAMVLNNLGYSLYLQGQVDAARVPLDRAAASDDTVVSAAARHTLMLIDAAADTPAAAVTVVAAQAHIEQSDDGEQRLVTRTDPAQEVAALGDDGALVAVAPRWTAHDDAALAAEERVADEFAAEASKQATATTAPTVPLAVQAELAPRDAKTRVPQADATAVTASVTSVGPAASATAWLISRPVTTPTRVAAVPRLNGLASSPRDRRTGFDSDDGELNAFATRMQDGPAVTVAEERAAAVTRLEALVARLGRS